MASNTEFNSLNAFDFIDNINLVVNQNSFYNTPLKSVPSFKILLEDLIKKAPNNFNRKVVGVYILNNKYAKLSSEIPKVRDRRPFGQVYECTIPYSEINLVLLDQTIVEIKGAKIPIPPKGL